LKVRLRVVEKEEVGRLLKGIEVKRLWPSNIEILAAQGSAE
jgi:hypothetical protein